MGRTVSIIYNTKKICTFAEFVSKQDKPQGDERQVCFVAMMGVSGNYAEDIAQMDRGIAPDVFYKRVGKLSALISPAQTEYYSNAYELWCASGRKKMQIKMKACSDDSFKELLGTVCSQAELLYKENSVSCSDSMLKNFVVKFLFWLDTVFEGEDFTWSPDCNVKIVAGNAYKKQEILFWYLFTRLGADVLLLQNETAVEKTSVTDFLHIVSLGELQPFVYPEWKRNAARNVSEGRPTLRVAATVKPAPVAATEAGMIKMAVPPHPSRKTNPVQPVLTGPRCEKSYEELARLATSVVMIAIHDADGKIIGSGSGIMIGPNGYILTNNHVACGGKFYSVKIEDEDKVYETDEVIKYNPLLDLAIIRIQRKLNVLPLYNGKEPLVRGQRVVAIGSPLGLFNSVSDGIIAGFRTIDCVDMIQFTAPISHGSSGGAVLNLYGEVIGISTAGFGDGQNINLAVGYESIIPFVKGFTG